MGAWGPGAFENDDAADWVWELEDAEDASVLFDALGAVADTPPGQQVDSADASNAIAAAHVVASARGTRTPQLPTEAQEWLRNHSALADAGLASMAAGVVERILIDSELKDEWDEAEDSSWQSGVMELLARLR